MDPDFGPEEESEPTHDDRDHQLPKPPAYPRLQELVEGLDHRHISHRLKALESLRLFAGSSSVAISAIVSALQDRSQHIRQCAREAIDQLGVRALPALVEAFQQSVEPATWKGLELLRRFPRGEAIILARAGDSWPGGDLAKLFLSEPATLPFALSPEAHSIIAGQLTGNGWNAQNFALAYIQQKPQLARHLIPELFRVARTARGVEQRLSSVEALACGIGTGDPADDRALRGALEQLRDEAPPATVAGAAAMLVALHADAPLQAAPLIDAIASPQLPRDELRPVLHFLKRQLPRNRLGFAAIVIDLLRLQWRVRQARLGGEDRPPATSP